MFVTTSVASDQRIKVSASTDQHTSIEIGTDYALGPDSSWWGPSLAIFLTPEQAADLYEQLGAHLAVAREVDA